MAQSAVCWDRPAPFIVPVTPRAGDIDGLGHTWARKEIDTTEVTWQFFKGQRLH